MIDRDAASLDVISYITTITNNASTEMVIFTRRVYWSVSQGDINRLPL